MSAEGVDDNLHGLGPQTHAEWADQERWPDEKLGEHLLASALLYEAEKQALRLRAAVPQLPAAGLVLTSDLGAIAAAARTAPDRTGREPR